MEYESRNSKDRRDAVKAIRDRPESSEDQKTQLRTALENARERMDAIRDKHPDVTKADVIAKLREVRGSLRERVVKFFTPEQLAKWDAGIARAKMFLGYSI